MDDLLELKNKAKKVHKKLKTLYPEAECELIFSSPFEVLVSTVLSAQCTDKKVNTVTPELFERYPSPLEMSQAKVEDVEKIIKSLGLYKNKAKSIVSASKDMVEKFGSKVPDTMEDLVRLAGVGRKTANCVLVNAFDKPGIMVDTHCIRLSNRLGLTIQSKPEKIEKELKEIFSKSIWGKLSHRIILHGRRICHAKNPECDKCTLKKLCVYYSQV